MPDTPRRPRRWLRWGLLALALLVLLPAAGLAWLLLAFDPDSLKPRIQTAVEAATGRALTLGGPIGVKPALVPTLTLSDVALANAPGGSRPQMATIRRVEVELALLPLLSRRVEVRRLALQAPDILLETDAEGRPNWAFAPPGSPAPAPAAPGNAAAPASAARDAGSRLGIAVDRVELTEGRIGWRNGQTGAARSLEIAQFETRATGDDGALRLSGRFALDGAPFTLAGETGSLAALTGGGAPWPLRLVLEAAGATIAAEGSIAQPLQAAGWQLAVDAKVPELARLAPLLPDAPLPPLRDLALTTRLADSGGRIPAVSDLRLTLGAAPLDAVLPGLSLGRLEASLPRQDAPLALSAEAALEGMPLRLAGSVGAPAALLAPPAQPWPVDLTLGLGAAEASAKGAIADPRAGTGVDLAVALRVPDLAALAPLARTPLPPVKDLAVEARVAERGPGFAAGAFLRGFRLTSSAADAAGELTYVIGQRQGFAGSLASQRIDLDALRPPPAAPAATAPAGPPPARDARLIPDVKLPLEAMRIIDSDLRWTVASLIAGGVTAKEVALRLVIQDGKAWLDPFTATLSGGPLNLRAAADLTSAPPTVQVAAQAPGLDLAPLLAALGRPPQVTGLLGLDADLRGRGEDLRAVAGSAHGHLGLSLVRGTLSGSLLEALPGDLRKMLLPPGQGGRDVALRCFALRLAAEDGMAQSRTLLLDSALGRMGGEGGLNLKTEALAFRLLPDLRLGGIELRAPVNVAGTMRSPRIGVSPEAAVAGGLGAFLSLQNSPDRGLQSLAGALGAGGPALPDCESQLAIARGNQPGPAPGPAFERPAPAQARDALPGPAGDLLRGLFGRGR
ncbi:AsmA family protein [Belnapia sp. T6]|uniref:AsmA family protein n=1 Tax=Belnapia mucosa TaxID=2804532 RepID=A0ABS1V5X7_9PROT|nr:AsmA family protein [Belnapia mucosa]MBL6456531.1 AsmA family protein [Belnapia mucosa]